MIATVGLALLVLLVALIYILGPTYGNEYPHWRRINSAQSLHARIVLICLGFGIAALLKSMPS
ncbi:hypothetical protein [Bradyrhizobium cenepequi]|uniref:hypothetical protein n=1 Tax=Bradyrhizobium cenepequi TaxID=2821403 RepID=UPI001CE25AC4|nr:hypothetical protein [Bradyrhizobium cenepequi]MCA6111716.1 hypothetical protein [Bradyrhizobium cenepequi]